MNNKDKLRNYLQNDLITDLLLDKIKDAFHELPSPRDYDVSNINLHGLYIDDWVLKCCALHVNKYKENKLYYYEFGRYGNEETLDLFGIVYKHRSRLKEETLEFLSDINSLQEMIDIIKANFSGKRTCFRLTNKTYWNLWNTICVYESEEVFKNYVGDDGEFETRIMT